MNEEAVFEIGEKVIYHKPNKFYEPYPEDMKALADKFDQQVCTIKQRIYYAGKAYYELEEMPKQGISQTLLEPVNIETIPYEEFEALFV